MENRQEETTQEASFGFPSKPIFLEDKKSWLRKSMINLAIYAFIFVVVLNIELIYGAAILIVLLIHETGHFLAMKAFKYYNPQLFTLPLLGSFNQSYNDNSITQSKMSIIILAGPIPGIIIGLLLLVCHSYYPNERLEMLGNIFVGLNFFNLLPFMPLDGGLLLENLFINHNYIIKLVFTILSIVLLLLFAIWFRYLFFLIIPISMVLELIIEFKNQRIRDYLNQEQINYIATYKELPDKNYWLIRDCILLSFNKRYSMVKAGEHQYTIIEGTLMKHVMSIIKAPITKDLKIIGKIMMLLILLAFLIIPITYYIPKALEAISSATIH